MVLVHGWGSDSDNNWVKSGWVDSLTPHRTVIILDVRGHGKSDKPHALESYSYAGMCSDVLAVLDQLGIKICDFMGYSMGSFMGAYLLGHHPERFSSMVLGGIGNETEATAAQGELIAQALRAENVSDIKNVYGKQVRAYVDANPNSDLESLAFSASKMWPEGYPLRIAGPGISKAQFPILIVNGEDDHPYVDTADLLTEALPDAHHLTIPDTDHMTVVADARFKQAVVEFITGNR